MCSKNLDLSEVMAENTIFPLLCLANFSDIVNEPDLLQLITVIFVKINLREANPQSFPNPAFIA